MLTIFHRYSKSTFTIFFSARVSDLHLFKASFLVFGCFLRQIHLLLSFPPQAQDIIFFLSDLILLLMKTHVHYAIVRSWTLQLQINLLHLLFSKNGRLAYYFHCIIEIRDISLRPSHLLLHFPPRGSFFSTSADRTIHPSRECFDLTCLLHTSPLQHVHQS